MVYGYKKSRAFTIVELLVVITVIGILAGIVVVSYGSWRTKAAKTEVRSDLTQLAVAMKNEMNFKDGYPTGTTLPSSFTASKDVTVARKSGGTATTYCINAYSNINTSVKYYITNTSTTPTVGTC